MWVAAGYQYKAIAHRATSLAPPLRDGPDVRGQAQQRRSPPAYLRPHTVAGPSRVRRLVQRVGLLCAVPAWALLQRLPGGVKGQSERKREPVCCTILNGIVPTASRGLSMLSNPCMPVRLTCAGLVLLYCQQGCARLRSRGSLSKAPRCRL